MYRLVGTDDSHQDSGEREQRQSRAVDARGDSRGSEPPDPRARLQSHVARRRAPRERRRQGQLLLPLQEQGRARLRDPRSDHRVLPRRDARAVLLGPPGQTARADPVLPGPGARDPAGAELRGWLRARQSCGRALGRARGIPYPPGRRLQRLARAVDRGSPRRTSPRRRRWRLPPGGGRALSRRRARGRHPLDEAHEGHRRHGAVRGRDEALPVDLRAGSVTTVETRKADTDAALVEALRREDEVALDDVLPALDGDGQHFEPMDDWSNRVDEQALQGELRRVLTTAVDALPHDYRTALVLHDIEGLSNPDIAEALGISLPAVKSRVHRSRLFVRKRLTEYMEKA